MDSAGKPGIPVPTDPGGIPPDVAVTVVVAVLVTELREVTVEIIEVLTVAAEMVTVETTVDTVAPPACPLNPTKRKIVDSGCLKPGPA